MPMFDVEAFVAKLDRMGLILTALALADGKLRVNRWRTARATEHTQQIEELWASEIGDDRSRINLLAAHLAGAHRRARLTANGGVAGGGAVKSSPPLIPPRVRGGKASLLPRRQTER